MGKSSTSFKVGNQSAKKLTSDELKAEAYSQYCKHIADGYPKQAFVFEHPDLTLVWATLDKCIESEPDNPVFDPVMMQKAKAKRYKKWFGEGETLMKGGYKNGSPQTWSVIMRNMFRDVGWDQEMRDFITSPDLKAAFEVVRASRKNDDK